MSEFHQQVRSVAYAPDGCSFAMADTGGKRVRIFRYKTGSRRAKLGAQQSSQDSVVRQASSSHRSVHRQVSLALDDLAYDAEEMCQWKLEGRCYGLAYSPDGKLLATANYEKYNAAIWEVGAAGKDRLPRLRATTKTGHTAGVHAVAFSPDCKHLATGSWDSTVRLWHSHSGEPVERNEDDEAHGTSGDGSADLVVLKGHDMRVVSVAYAPVQKPSKQDPRIIATASCDGTVKTWEAETGDLLHTYRVHTEKPHMYEFPTVVFAPDGSTFATNGDHGSVVVFSLALDGDGSQVDRAVQAEECIRLTNRAAPLNSHSRHGGSIRKAFNLAVEKDGSDTQSLRVSSIAYSADGCLLAVGHADSLIRLWDLSLGEVVQIFRGHTKGEVWSMAFDPSLAWERSQGLLSGGNDGTARVWNTFSNGACAGECTRQVRVQDRVLTTVTAAGPVDSRATRTMPAHDKDVTKVVYAPDGQSFVSAGFDNAVRIWGNVADSANEWRGAQVQTEIMTDGPVTAAAWTYEDQFAAGFVYHTAFPATGHASRLLHTESARLTTVLYMAAGLLQLSKCGTSMGRRSSVCQTQTAVICECLH